MRYLKGSNVKPAKHWAKNAITTKSIDNLLLIRTYGDPDLELTKYQIGFEYEVFHYLGTSKYEGFRIVTTWASCPQSAVDKVQQAWKRTGKNFRIVDNME